MVVDIIHVLHVIIVRRRRCHRIKEKFNKLLCVLQKSKIRLLFDIVVKLTRALGVIATTGSISKAEYSLALAAKEVSKATDCGMTKNTWIINYSFAILFTQNCI